VREVGAEKKERNRERTKAYVIGKTGLKLYRILLVHVLHYTFFKGH
jgi:RPA family protein